MIVSRFQHNSLRIITTCLVCCFVTSSMSRVSFSNSSWRCCKYCVISAKTIAHCLTRNSLSNFTRLKKSTRFHMKTKTHHRCTKNFQKVTGKKCKFQTEILYIITVPPQEANFVMTKYKATYCAEACNEWRAPSPRLSAWAHSSEETWQGWQAVGEAYVRFDPLEIRYPDLPRR